MSRKDELLALAERVDALTGADREVDAAIAVVVFGGTIASPPGCYWTGGEYYHATSAIAYTASLDAAMSLVSEGFVWRIMPSDYERNWLSEVWSIGNDGKSAGYSRAATATLALTAAALRAIAKTEGQQP